MSSSSPIVPRATPSRRTLDNKLIKINNKLIKDKNPLHKEIRRTLKYSSRDVKHEVVDRDEAGVVDPMGRQWLHAPWRALRAQYRTANGDVIVTATVRAR